MLSLRVLPTERPGPHIQGDVRLLREPWDLVIAAKRVSCSIQGNRWMPMNRLGRFLP